MVGLGETMEEMLEAFAILREHEVQVLTVGQYLRPSESHLPVVRYWAPDEFAELEREAYALGFESVASGPLVRSSYHADEQVPVRRTALTDPRRSRGYSCRVRDPAPGQHPDRPLPGRHGGDHRDQRVRVPVPAGAVVLALERAGGRFEADRRVRRDSLPHHAPGRATAASSRSRATAARRRLVCEGAGLP